MKNLAAEFLTEEEQKRVTDTVHEMELQTSGEIVPMIVTASNNYPLSAAIAATVIAIPTGLLGSEIIAGILSLTANTGIGLFILLTSLFFAAVFYLLVKEDKLLSLRRHFLLQKDVELEVRESAFAAFYSEGLYKTHKENGILLYISVFERKVWILADRGINDKIAVHTWQKIVDELTEAIREEKNCEGICHAIERIGTILKEHFPHQKNDENELNNLIIRS